MNGFRFAGAPAPREFGNFDGCAVDRIIDGAIRLMGVVWLLSWFGLYLEIYRYHHVALSRITDVLWPLHRPNPGPGGFVWSVVLWSLLSPPLFVVLWAWRWRQRVRHVDPNAVQRPSGMPALLMLLGVGLAALVIVNQLVRHPPLILDLTLRTGNVGFVVIAPRS